VHSAEARTGSLLFSTLGKNEDENDSFKKNDKEDDNDHWG